MCICALYAFHYLSIMNKIERKIFRVYSRVILNKYPPEIYCQSNYFSVYPLGKTHTLLGPVNVGLFLVISVRTVLLTRYRSNENSDRPEILYFVLDISNFMSEIKI